MTNKTQIAELRDALIAALEWIDAVPSDTELPAMPGFDRDYVDSLIAGLKPAAPVVDAVPDLFLLPVMRDGEKLYSECGKDYPRGRGYFTHAPPLPVENVDDLVMQIRRLVQALRMASPDNNLPGKVSDYMRRKGYFKNTDCLRAVKSADGEGD